MPFSCREKIPIFLCIKCGQRPGNKVYATTAIYIYFMKTMNYNHVKIFDAHNIDSAMENYAAASPCCCKRGEEQLVVCPSVLFYIQNSIPYHVTRYHYKEVRYRYAKFSVAIMLL